MTDRLLLGNRNGEMGLWISKPGFNVFTAQPGDMLLTANNRAAQIITTFDISFPGNVTTTRDIVVPGLDYNPWVIVNGWFGGPGPVVRITYPSPGVIRVIGQPTGHGFTIPLRFVVLSVPV